LSIVLAATGTERTMAIATAVASVFIDHLLTQRRDCATVGIM
jgi:hypothetical protein